MDSVGVLYEYAGVSKRLAEAQNVSELEKEWQSAQRSFQKSWDWPNHKLIILVHDQHGEISDTDVEEVVTAISSTDRSTPIDVILHTHGGFASPSKHIADALLQRKRTTTFVPIFAHSGGTIIALSSELICMGASAQLSPVDLQVNYMSGHEFVRLVEELGADASPIDRAAARDVQKALNEHREEICHLMNRRHKGWFGWRGCELAETLTSGDLRHSSPIRYSTAKRLHMNVSKKMPKSIFAIISSRLQQLRRLRELESQTTVIEKLVPLTQKSAAVPVALGGRTSS